MTLSWNSWNQFLNFLPGSRFQFLLKLWIGQISMKQKFFGYKLASQESKNEIAEHGDTDFSRRIRCRALKIHTKPVLQK